ncbi:hypothetical protein [uncultured Microbulbifer sp.]|uniref:hypothetical protein n=1 Tax=uncultured Microbulbifer sp. TaxID=348147 RepID=UPI00262822AE|nr:hypothetical protein [uncultured Microbulbifer sp.]
MACCGPYQNVGFLQATSRATNPKYKRHWPGKFQARVFGEVLQEIAEHGFLRQHKGTIKNGLTTLWMLTGSGREWVQQAQSGAIGVPFSEGKDLLLLKSDKKKPIEFEDDDNTVMLKAQVQRTNESRAGYSWGYSPVDLEQSGKEGNAEWVYADVQVALPSVDLECHRDFRESFETGGRYFCKAQQLRKVERSTITVDGLPTIELDYSSHQTRILYHLCGLDAPEDCYDIPGQSRSIWKKVAVIVLYCKSRRQALTTLVNHLEVDWAEAKQFLCDYSDQHSGIADKFFQAKWGELFYAESQLTMDVLDAAYAAAIPLLPIHDSFVTTTKHAHTLREIMNSCYMNRFGFPAAIGQDSREDIGDFFAELEGQ